MRVLHSIFFYALTVVSFFLGTLFTLCFVPLAKDKAALFQTAARRWARFLSFFTGVKIKTSGIENIPRDKAVIFASNHQGAADILILLAYLPIPFRFAIKKELFRVPFFGWYLKQAGFFSVDRKQMMSAYRSLEAMVEILKQGDSVLIFPEGTRTKTGALGAFKRGSLLAAQKSGAPIVPLAISGSFNIMPRGSFLINPCPVKFSAGPPIHITSEADYENKVEEVRAAIAQML